MISQQTCPYDHKMDQSVWQTSSTFDLLHSFHEWKQTKLSCWKYSPKIQIMTVTRFWHCGKSGRFEIDFRWIIVSIRKSHVCYNKLDVQETDMCVPQFNGFWHYFSGYRFTHGRNSRPRSFGFRYYCDALKLKSRAERQVSTKKSVTRQSIREVTNSTSHQTRTTRTFFSWALRMTQVISFVLKTVILICVVISLLGIDERVFSSFCFVSPFSLFFSFVLVSSRISTIAWLRGESD